jgi:hypothetical protein
VQFAILYLILLGLIIIPVSCIGYEYLRLKGWYKKVYKYSEEYGEKIKNEGIAKEDAQMSTERLFFEMKKLEEESLKNQKDIKVFVEKGCKAKIMEDILNERNVEIPKPESEL